VPILFFILNQLLMFIFEFVLILLFIF